MTARSVPPRTVAVRFLLDADADAGLLPRLLQPFAKRDLIPEHMNAARTGATMQVEILLLDADPAEVARIAGNLGQVVGVRHVSQMTEPVMRAA